MRKETDFTVRRRKDIICSICGIRYPKSIIGPLIIHKKNMVSETVEFFNDCCLSCALIKLRKTHDNKGYKFASAAVKSRQKSVQN